MDFLDRVAAPDWFIEANTLHNKLFKEQADMLGEDLMKSFTKVVKKKNLTPEQEIGEVMKLAGDLTAKGKMPPLEVQKKVGIIQNYSSIVQNSAWARFRYENADNQFGMADKLHYDEKKKFIEIVK